MTRVTPRRQGHVNIKAKIFLLIFTRSYSTTSKDEVKKILALMFTCPCRRGVTRLSQDCHRNVTRLSRHVTGCHRCVATCHQDVTAESHFCHKLSQGVTTAVTSITPSHRVSKHLLTCRHVDISWLRGGVKRGRLPVDTYRQLILHRRITPRCQPWPSSPLSGAQLVG